MKKYILGSLGLLVFCASIVFASMLISKSIKGLPKAIIKADGFSVDPTNYWEDPLIDKRIIVFTDIISVRSAKKLISQLLFLEYKFPGEPINLILKTSGGSRADWMAIVNTMRLISSPVNVIATGKTVSAGAYILAAATGERIVLSNSLIGIHMVFREYELDDEYSSELKNAQFLLYFWKKYAELPNKFLPEEGEKLNETFYLTSDEALKFGIVDKIINLDEADLNIFNLF